MMQGNKCEKVWLGSAYSNSLAWFFSWKNPWVFSLWLLFEEFLNYHLTGKNKSTMLLRKNTPWIVDCFSFRS